MKNSASKLRSLFILVSLIFFSSPLKAGGAWKKLLEHSRAYRSQLKAIEDYQRGEWRAAMYSHLGKNPELRNEVASSLRPQGAQVRHLRALAPHMKVLGVGGSRTTYEHPFSINLVIKIMDDQAALAGDVLHSRARREAFLEEMLKDRNVPLARTIARYPEDLGLSVHERAQGLTFNNWLVEKGISKREWEFRNSMRMQITESVALHQAEISNTMRRVYGRNLIPETRDNLAGIGKLDLHNGNFMIDPITLEWRLVDF